jgi:hypothetical protein
MSLAIKLSQSTIYAGGIAAALLVGCQTDEAERTKDGLSIVEMNEAAGKLVVDYRHGDRWIQYDLRLGTAMEIPPTAEELVANPELPTYNVDVRVVDADGRPFVLQMAGDAFLDPTWQSPAVEGFDEQGRVRDFQLMGSAVADFRTLDLPQGLDELRRAAIQVGLGASAEVDKPELLGTGPSQRGVIAWGPTSVAKWDFIVRKKPFGCCGVGDHSAVELRGWSASSSVVYRAYSCNHGTCASDTSVMGTHCVMPGFRTDDGTHSRYFYSDGCTTSYNVTSVWGHNCNDDSELQGRAIWYDSSQSTTGGSCNSAGAHNWAPGCSY